MSRDADPVPGIASRAGRLSDPARRVHRAVLGTFAAAGQPPSAAEIERLARAGGRAPDRVRAELAEADLLAFTAQGEVRAVTRSPLCRHRSGSARPVARMPGAGGIARRRKDLLAGLAGEVIDADAGTGTGTEPAPG